MKIITDNMLEILLLFMLATTFIIGLLLYKQKAMRKKYADGIEAIESAHDNQLFHISNTIREEVLQRIIAVGKHMDLIRNDLNHQPDKQLFELMIAEITTARSFLEKVSRDAFDINTIGNFSENIKKEIGWVLNDEKFTTTVTVKGKRKWLPTQTQIALLETIAATVKHAHQYYKATDCTVEVNYTAPDLYCKIYITAIGDKNDLEAELWQRIKLQNQEKNINFQANFDEQSITVDLIAANSFT